MRYTQTKSGILIPRSPKYQRGFLGAGAAFFSGNNTPPGGDPYYNDVSSLLHFNQQTTERSWTANGNAEISIAQSKFGGASGYFDGTNSYITSTAPDMANGPYTIEGFFRPLAGLAGGIINQQYTGAGDTVPFAVGLSSNGTPTGSVGLVPFFGMYDGAWHTITGGTALTINTWYHIAATVDASKVYRLFINGALVASATIANTIPTSSRLLIIGRRWDAAGTPYFNGYIDEVRITKGIARYTANFTPPAAPFDGTDTYFSDVISLLHFDGADTSKVFTDSSSPTFNPTIFTDSKNNVWTASGNAVISTARSKFGGASGFFDGAPSYISTPASTPLNLSAVNFTLEAFVYLTAYTTGDGRILDKDGQAFVSYPQYALLITSTGFVSVIVGSGSGTSWYHQLNGITKLALNTWYHVAATRSGNLLSLFLNGNLEATWTITSVMTEGGRPLLIGYEAAQSASSAIKGYIDEVRITKGIARYTANFIPPTAPYPDT